MNRAGADREVFTADALTLLHEAAGSSLREIDRMGTSISAGNQLDSADMLGMPVT